MAAQEGDISISVEEIKMKESPTMQRDNPGSNNSRAEDESKTETVEVEHLNKVPEWLKEMDTFLKFFEPRAVSLGPYHHHKEHLQVTVDDKRKIKDGLLHNKGKKAEDFDEEMSIALKDARDLYLEDNNQNMSSEEFNDMMILDACFIFHIVDYIADYPIMCFERRELKIKYHLLPLVLEDIFLLENQVPFAVLEAAMISLGEGAKEMTRDFVRILNLSTEAPSGRSFFDKFDDSHRIIKCIIMPVLILFIRIMYFRRIQFSSWFQHNQLIEKRDRFWSGGNKVHLLRILRAELLSYEEEKKYEPPSDLGNPTLPYFWHPTRCATELKAAGINFEKREGLFRSLGSVKFEEGFIFGQLLLPSINELTKRRLLNLIAYELSSKHCGYGITTYFSFLDGLIDRPDDVKELRSKNILPRGLGSDEEVAAFFNMVGTDLNPDPRVYYKVLDDIETHCRNTWRADIAAIRHKYFGSRSDIISFLIAAFLFFIALAQAYTTFFPIKK